MTTNSLNALDLVRKHLEQPDGNDPLGEIGECSSPVGVSDLKR